MNEEELKTKNQEALRKQARGMIILAGENYIRLYGSAKVTEDMKNLKEQLHNFNLMMHGSLSLNINTVSAMMSGSIVAPVYCGLDLLNNKGFQENQMKLAAILLTLTKERDEKLKLANPELST